MTSSESAEREATVGSVDTIYRTESRRVLATLIRLLGDFDLAEEALHEAFRAALEQWPREGLPQQPRAWLVSTGRFKAIDAIRRQRKFDALDDHADHVDELAADEPANAADIEDVEDDRLRLIFTCCHPALADDARSALTLREVCGLTTEAIASAFLVRTPTIAQRIVRAKAKIKQARIPYQVPSLDELPERLDAVLRVIYLVFNEGYAASSGAQVLRHDLCAEAIRLSRLLLALLPKSQDQAAVQGLLALMLLQDSRRDARTTDSGDMVLLEHQDRSRWHADKIAEGLGLVKTALAQRPVSPYALQAAIAAVHAEAASSNATDWPQIVALYDALLEIDASPVIALNRAVALAMRDGAQAGLAAIEQITAANDLGSYHLLHAARGHLLQRLGQLDAARLAFGKALSLAQQQPEQRFLQQCIAKLGSQHGAPQAQGQHRLPTSKSE